MYEKIDFDFSKNKLNNLFQVKSKTLNHNASPPLLDENTDYLLIMTNDMQWVSDFIDGNSNRRYYILLDKHCVNEKRIRDYDYVEILKTDFLLPNIIIGENQLYYVSFNKMEDDVRVIQKASDLFKYLFVNVKKAEGLIEIHYDVSAPITVEFISKNDFESKLTKFDKAISGLDLSQLTSNDFELITNSFKNINPGNTTIIDAEYIDSCSFLSKEMVYIGVYQQDEGVYLLKTSVNLDLDEYTCYIHKESETLENIAKEPHVDINNEQIVVEENEKLSQSYDLDMVEMGNKELLKKIKDTAVEDFKKKYSYKRLRGELTLHYNDLTLEALKTKHLLRETDIIDIYFNEQKREWLHNFSSYDDLSAYHDTLSNALEEYERLKRDQEHYTNNIQRLSKLKKKYEADIKKQKSQLTKEQKNESEDDNNKKKVLKNIKKEISPGERKIRYIQKEINKDNNKLESIQKQISENKPLFKKAQNFIEKHPDLSRLKDQYKNCLSDYEELNASIKQAYVTDKNKVVLVASKIPDIKTDKEIHYFKIIKHMET